MPARSPWLEILPPFLLAATLTYLLTGVVRFLAPRAGLVDRPRQDRWHRRAVPRLGGAAMVAAYLATVLVFARGPYPREVTGILAGGLVMFLVGLVDDLHRLENRPKLLLLIMTACVPAFFGLRFGSLPPILGVPLTVLWILGATNALNWLDNMDGLVGGVAAIASGMFLVLAVPTGSAIPVLLAVTLLGVSLGFLAHNFPPARVFMGDCGSGFLGFTLAATATLGSSRDVANVLLALLIPGLVLAVPIFDTLTVTWLRARHGRSILQGGRDHPSHRLVAMGLSERRAVLLLYMLSALSGGVGILAWHLGALPGLVVTAVLALGFGALGVVLAEVRTYGDEPPPHQATVLPGPIMHKRWLVSMILDLVLLCVAFAAAHLLRFEGQVPDHVAAAAAQALPIMLVAKMAVLYGLGIYRGTWRYVGILDLIRLGQAASLGSLAATAALFFMTKAEGLSRAALVLDWVLTVGLLASGRMAIRGVREYLVAHRQSGQRVLIVGSGEGGALLARALRQMPGLGYLPVGHLTCGPAVAEGAVMNGLPVLGSHANIDEVLREHRVEAVVLVPSELNGAERRIRDACDQAGIPVKRMGRLIE